ncbi:hypothetical protein BAUCODRAFT_283867 [Baudoinia panamericana UAMH 10762]|uniref:Uncharacterized protein n=1 Tax=Baudoinia panamericana (strain UAMH 10762) TaxID=717646 RepID=M2N0V3_BAUPA|nr:uncharacterized protein BAUCODRAFT_283867 [Baudoinia panamericana UAMH 10762]EMC92265.1 hypothetical protein BAUCODRAFT_283867 [Baudoinia panamericana UAMH 10762]
MATSQQVHNALLTEHFRYTPLTLLDDIINTVNELVYRAVSAIEEGLNNVKPEALGFTLSPSQAAATLPSEEARQDALYHLKESEIGNGIVQLESLLNATVDRDFDKFEIYTLRNIMAIGHEDEARDLAQWVRLEHYKQLDLAAVENVPSPEEVQLQRRKLQETRKLNAMLKAEEAKNAAVLEQLGGLTGGSGDASQSPFAFLTESARNGQPMEQSVQYALTQLPALRDLLAQLQQSVQTLPNARQHIEDPESKAARRRQYLDTQAKKAMVRRGVEPTASESADVSAGRKIGRDEVEGMEAVVQALGGAPATRHAMADDE